MKKLMAALMAVAMLCALAVPAFAAEVTNPSVDISKHSFEAYQIFTGTLSEGDKLSDVKWGDGVKSAELLTALKNTTEYGDFSKATTAVDVAEKLSALSTDKATDFAKFVVDGQYLTTNKTEGTGSVTLPAAGYYLIKDVTDVADKDDALNLTLLQVSSAQNVTPKVKTDKPTVVKKVKDTNDSVADSTTGWQDSADYDIGDTIPYQLTATLGDVSNYKTYYVQFVDTMTHLTFKEITSVKIDSTVLTAGQYQEHWDATSKTLTVTIDDAKALGATNRSVIQVEYTATLDSNAVIGSTGNPNEVYLNYSNNPNGSGTGKTAPDKNIVFTYQVTVNKVDQSDKALAGAAFALYKKLSAGTSATGADIIEVNGEHYKLVSTQNVGENGTVADATKTSFDWTGIDDGDYLLREVITPTGYNSIDDITFTVTADHEVSADNPQLISLTAGDKFTGVVSTGTLSANIQNRMGSVLPSTGGIGTTIFYVVGGGLMIAAAVLLITKKRMEGKN